MYSPLELGFDHRYIPGSGPMGGITMLLLHGTGGDGDSLLQLGGTLLPGATLLSPTGNVREHGAPRFFRRLAEGVFDEADLLRRTDELVTFLHNAVGAYHLDANRVIAVGYSNGANIAASVLLKHPGVLAAAILFRAMVPFVPDVAPVLPETPVLIAAGAFDPVMPRSSTEQLAQLLRGAHAALTVHYDPAGHELTMGDVQTAQQWLARTVTDLPSTAA
jgi:phospholipase/carboxylesterase